MSKKNYNRLPLDLPVPKTGKRRTVSNRVMPGDKFGVYEETSPIFTKILVAIVIIIVVMIAKNMDTDFSQKVVGYLKDGITKDMDIDETLGKLKFVNGYLSDAKAVFGIQGQDGIPDEEDIISEENLPTFAIPAEGKVTGFFGTDNSGIDIMGRDNPRIYAVSEGKVLSIGDDDRGQKYIRISHGDNLTSLYEGCSEVKVGIGDNLNKGDIIATMGRDSSGVHWLHFEVWVDGKPVNPLDMIEKVAN